MPTPFEEIGRSGEFSYADSLFTGDRVYDVFDATDEADAVTDALTQLTTDIGGTTLHGSPISSISFDETEKADTYRVRFHFKPLEPIPPQQPGDGPRTDFEFSDNDERRYFSYQTTSYGVSLNYGNAIGAKRNSNYRLVVDGADMPNQAFNFSKRIVTLTSVITNSFVIGLADLVGTVNDDSFYDFPANEVLFRGISGSTKSATEFELNFRFSARPNQTGLTIGTVSSISANGWDIIEPLFDEEEDLTNGVWVPVINTVFVHRVRNQGDFSNLPV